MKYIKLFTDEDNKSHFMEMNTDLNESETIGHYSEKFPVAGLLFREFQENEKFDWHTAPQPQYIIYLEGQIEIETSCGEKRVFGPGDILFVSDVSGFGHVTRTLSKGKSVIVTTR